MPRPPSRQRPTLFSTPHSQPQAMSLLGSEWSTSRASAWRGRQLPARYSRGIARGETGMDIAGIEPQRAVDRVPARPAHRRRRPPRAIASEARGIMHREQAPAIGISPGAARCRRGAAGRSAPGCRRPGLPYGRARSSGALFDQRGRASAEAGGLGADQFRQAKAPPVAHHRQPAARRASLRRSTPQAARLGARASGRAGSPGREGDSTRPSRRADQPVANLGDRPRIWKLPRPIPSAARRRRETTRLIASSPTAGHAALPSNVRVRSSRLENRRCRCRGERDEYPHHARLDHLSSAIVAHELAEPPGARRARLMPERLRHAPDRCDPFPPRHPPIPVNPRRMRHLHRRFDRHFISPSSAPHPLPRRFPADQVEVLGTAPAGLGAGRSPQGRKASGKGSQTCPVPIAPPSPSPR